MTAAPCNRCCEDVRCADKPELDEVEVARRRCDSPANHGGAHRCAACAIEDLTNDAPRRPGRPRKDPRLLRVRKSTMVAPETAKYFSGSDVPIGEVLDAYVSMQGLDSA